MINVLCEYIPQSVDLRRIHSCSSSVVLCYRLLLERRSGLSAVDEDVSAGGFTEASSSWLFRVSGYCVCVWRKNFNFQ